MSTLERIENLKDTECIVDMLLKEVRANPCQACGKCVFGYEGITQLELTLSDITEKKGRSGDLDLMKDLCQVMKTQSLCETGEEIAEAVLTAIRTHSADFEEHRQKSLQSRSLQKIHDLSHPGRSMHRLRGLYG